MILLYPYRLILIIPVLAVLFFLIRKEFVKITDLREKYFRKKLKAIVFLLRSLAFVLLIIAFAVPVAELKETLKGEEGLDILVDNSKSFEIYDKSSIYTLQEKLDKKISTELIPIGFEYTSPIGDGILSAISKSKSLLVVSDGNVNSGLAVDDVAVLASNINSSISLLELPVKETEMSVKIDGPGETTQDVLNEFKIIINNPSKIKVRLIVDIDNNAEIDEFTDDEEITLKRSFLAGYHRITAKIEYNDYFKENNIFYKVIHVKEKPKILFYSEGSSPMLMLLEKIYTVDTLSLDRDLEDYYAIIVNNINAAVMDKYTDKLATYLQDGDGLVVIGGKDSYDQGGYGNSKFETILPVIPGIGELEEKKVLNAVVLLDVSSGTQEPLCTGIGGLHASGALEIEKAQALNLVNGFRDYDKVAFVAYDETVKIISPMSTIGSKNLEELKSKIKKLQWQLYGTKIDIALDTAAKMLEGIQGEKYLILVSDGYDPNYFNYPAIMYPTFSYINDHNIKVVTIAAGRTMTEEECSRCSLCFKDIQYIIHIRNLIDIATRTNGQYIGPEYGTHGRYMPKDFKQVNAFFKLKKNQEEMTKEEIYSLLIMNNYHFITENLKLGASVNGYNFVVPKSSADLLITNGLGNPILTVWRFGLGRVASLSTDDGSSWGGELLNEQNSRLISRTVNWAIGDPDRKKEYNVVISDSTVDASVKAYVKSDKLPVSENLVFHKSGENEYKAEFTDSEPGFHSILGATYAINYNSELADIGINPDLMEMVSSTGGKIYKSEDSQSIIEKVVSASKRTVVSEKKIIWPFVVAALILFLLEIFYRRIMENR